MTPVLAIDTSASIVSVALGSTEKFTCVLGTAAESCIEELPALYENVVLQYGAPPRAIVIGNGPGSFTGLRIGYAFAQGLAYSLGLPCLELSSLAGAAMARSRELKQHGEFVVTSDARRDEFFTAHYHIDEQGLQEKLSPQIVSSSDLKLLMESIPNPTLIALQKDTVSIASGLLILGCKEGASHQGIATPQALASLTPHYLRAVAAKTIAERQIEKSC